MPKNTQYLRKPKWLYAPIRAGLQYGHVSQTIEQARLHTICQSGRCPNQGHCWQQGTATIMILGDRCTRACRFCSTKTGKPLPPDPDEPRRVAESIAAMKLRHAVITSVDRDDLEDKGSRHWAETIKAVRKECPDTIIEVLIPDYTGEELVRVLDARPDIVGHNLETVERLTPRIRSKATYARSLTTLRQIAEAGFLAKTGIMVGLGENPEEVEALIADAAQAGVSMMTIGQYLQPTDDQVPVSEYIHPDQFAHYREVALAAGLKSVESGPFVRSSYMAEHTFVRDIVEANRRPR